MSKLATNVFLKDANSIGNKAIFKKMEESQKKLDIPTSNLIALRAATFEKEDYVSNTISMNFNSLNELLWAML